MKNKLIAWILAPLALFSASCASGPKYTEVADRIPMVAEGQGRIYFYRTAVVGAAVAPEVQLNEEVVGKATAKGFFFVDRPPGDYVVSCSTEEEHRLSFTLAEDETRYVKLLMQMGLFVGHVLPELVDESEARDDLGSTKFTGDETFLSGQESPIEPEP